MHSNVNTHNTHSSEVNLFEEILERNLEFGFSHIKYQRWGRRKKRTNKRKLEKKFEGRTDSSWQAVWFWFSIVVFEGGGEG
jgi:hypothetical protein